MKASGHSLRRLGVEFTFWRFWCPDELLQRFDRLLFNRATNRRMYGLRSHVLTELLNQWYTSLTPEKKREHARRTYGFRREGLPCTNVKFNLPAHLAREIDLMFSEFTPDGKPIRFRSKLCTDLLTEWLVAQEAALEEVA